jgi:hypothetical protein
MARRGWLAVVCLAVSLVFGAGPAYAQGGSTTATLSGVVTDNQAGVVPGATVTVKNNATGESVTAVTNASGVWSLPGLSVGTYTVTIALTGFKTAEVKDVRLIGGSTNNIQTKLEVGQFQEVVTVSGGTDLIRAATPTVTSTINSDFITTLPRADRNALSFLIFLPGVTTTGGSRGSTVSGLPQNTINITIDGVSNSNMLQSGDGFFTMVVPRLDAIEEVSMTTATAGADATGAGAVNIRFQTRSGTNRYETSLYTYNQHKKFNSNTFFNALNGLPIPAATNWTYGGRIGGPIVLPGLFDGRGKAFFFFNYEEVYNPIETPRGRTIIRQSALDGNFTYNQTNPTTVNVLALAAANGQVSTYDPTIRGLLDAIRAAAQTTGTITELVTSPNTAAFNFLVPNKGVRHNPTQSVTVNITPKHRLQGSYLWQRFNNTPDTLNSADATFPGFPAYGDQSSYRTSGSINLRSTLSSAIVNELVTGWQSSPLGFFDNSDPSMFENQGGYGLALGFGLTNAHPGNARTPSSRNTRNWTIDNTFSWLKGSHSMSFGANFTRIVDWADNWTNVPAVTLGFSTANDPAEGMFTAANFPGSSTGDRTNARALYALLTGRVTAIGGTGRLNEAGTEYVYNGHAIRRERMDDYSFYAQDQWRWKPTLTVTAGLRYQFQLPMQPINSVMSGTNAESACGPSGFGDGPYGLFCNVFNPGDFRNPGVVPQYNQYTAGTKGYNTDKNNIAPNIGLSWRPNVQGGWLRSILGDPEIATVSAGFSRSFNKERVDRFLNVYDGNPGQSVPADRGTGAGAFPIVLPGESWPLLYREKSRLGPPAFQQSPAFPLTISRLQDVFIFDPDIVIPHTDSWSMSFQRSLDRNTVAEVRYIGNKNNNAWIDLQTWSGANPYQTGLLGGEFELAQQNLRANVVAGRGATFAYAGPNTGTSPLPMLFAHLTPQATATCQRGNCAAAGNPALYTSTQWTNSTWISDLDPYNPDPFGMAANLYEASSGQWWNNALANSYPTNFWVFNPIVDDVFVTRNDPGHVRNHQVIGELRRRLSAGLAVQGSYTYHRRFTRQVRDFQLPMFDLESTQVPHAFKMLWAYDIPFGRGKRFGANINKWVDYALGGWTFSGAGRVQVQSFFLRDTVLVGMSLDEARAALKEVRITTDPVSGAPRVYNFPEDIRVNTQRAYNYDETLPNFYAPGTEPTGRYFAPAGGPACNWMQPGDCGVAELAFLGRWFGEFDFRINKMVPVGKTRLEVAAEVFNAMKAKNFPTSLNPGGGDIFRITGTNSGARTAQIVFRVSW